MYTDTTPLHRAKSYHNNFISSDLDETKQYIGQALKPHALTLLDHRQSLNVKVGRTDFGRMSFMYIHHGADVHVYPGKLETLFLFQVPIHANRQEVRVGNSVFSVSPGIAYVVSPTLELELRMSKYCDNVVLAIERSWLEEFLEKLLQRRLDKPLEFSPRIDLSQCGNQELVRLMSHMTRQLNLPSSSLRNAMIQTQAESLLMSTMLINLEHNYRAELMSETAAPRPHYIKKAQAYILENARDALTPEDIAREACVSLRSIYAGFQTYLHCTPMTYVKNIKLEKINEELKHGDAATTSISDIVSKYGIASLGNFSASYRKRFGELPSDTLRRGRF